MTLKKVCRAVVDKVQEEYRARNRVDPPYWDLVRRTRNRIDEGNVVSRADALRIIYDDYDNVIKAYVDNDDLNNIDVFIIKPEMLVSEAMELITEDVVKEKYHMDDNDEDTWF